MAKKDTFLSLVGSCWTFFLATTPVFAAVSYEGKGLRDPFVSLSAEISRPKSSPDSYAEDLVGSLKLQGVLYDTAHPRAIISGKIYALGDTLGVWKVTGIEQGQVIFSANGKDYALKQTTRKMSDDHNTKNTPLSTS